MLRLHDATFAFILFAHLRSADAFPGLQACFLAAFLEIF